LKAALYALPLAAAVAGCVSVRTKPPPAGTPGQQAVVPATRPPWEREWAYLSRYHEANAKLAPPAAGERRIVFLGDSITESWAARGSFFPGEPYVNRGIGGQTTAQMLVRFRQDVIGLNPALVVILAGTNDIAENGGPTTLEAIEDNLQSMAELAKLNGIRVILASNLPAIDYPWRRGLEPADKISALNRWIAEYCATNHLVYLDYYSAMVDDKRALRRDLSNDGVHPTAAGFAVMAPLAEKAIRDALD
jgi:lysophospholipase L1-like esterase